MNHPFRRALAEKDITPRDLLPALGLGEKVLDIYSFITVQDSTLGPQTRYLQF